MGESPETFEEYEGRRCEICGKPVYQGFTDDWGEFYCCEGCFEAYMNKEYGEDNWKESGDEECGPNGGYYIATVDGGESWFDTGVYYTEWEEDE